MRFPSIECRCAALASLAASAAALAVFAPVLANGFVNWDDEFNFLQNPYYRGLGWTELRWMATNLDMGHWQPLAWALHGLTYTLWGMNPFGYHLASWLLHAACAGLLALACGVLFRLSIPGSAAPGRWLAAALAAAAWAAHPLRAETAAWATAQRDLLAAVFLLLSLLAYLRAAERNERRRLWLAGSAALYFASLASKPLALPYPAALLALDVYLARFRRQRTARLLAEKGPFLALAIGAAALAFAAEHRAEAFSTAARGPLAERALLSLVSPAFYAWLIAAPFWLAPVYERPAAVSLANPALTAGAASVVLATASLVAWRRRAPGALAAWILFLLFLAPVAGLFPIGRFFAADRYALVPTMSLAAALGGGWLLLGPRARKIGAAAILALALGWGVLSWRQCAIWRDSETLWNAAAERWPRCATARQYRAAGWARAGRLGEALAEYRLAVQLDPEYYEAWSGLAAVLSLRGEWAEAERILRRLVQAAPNQPNERNNLGNTLAASGRLAEAAAEYKQALALDPSHVDAWTNLGAAHFAMGQFEQALHCYRRALELAPGNARARQGAAAAERMAARMERE